MAVSTNKTEPKMSELIQATQLFAEARHLESIGEYRNADKLLAKSDKIMAKIFDELMKRRQCQQ